MVYLYDTIYKLKKQVRSFMIYTTINDTVKLEATLWHMKMKIMMCVPWI